MVIVAERDLHVREGIHFGDTLILILLITAHA